MHAYSYIWHIEYTHTHIYLISIKMKSLSNKFVACSETKPALVINICMWFSVHSQRVYNVQYIGTYVPLLCTVIPWIPLYYFSICTCICMWLVGEFGNGSRIRWPSVLAWIYDYTRFWCFTRLAVESVDTWNTNTRKMSHAQQKWGNVCDFDTVHLLFQLLGKYFNGKVPVLPDSIVKCAKIVCFISV